MKLTDFMKLSVRNARWQLTVISVLQCSYDDKPGPTMVINTETNLWRIPSPVAYGGIYDLAYELTGSCNMSELNLYIRTMVEFDRKTAKEQNRISKARAVQTGPVTTNANGGMPLWILMTSKKYPL